MIRSNEKTDSNREANGDGRIAMHGDGGIAMESDKGSQSDKRQQRGVDRLFELS